MSHPTGVPLNMINDEPALFVFLVVVLLVGFAIMGKGAKNFRTSKLIMNTPPERVRSVAVGRTELHGTARDAGVVFDEPFTNGKCLYYSYSVKEQREIETTDEDGNKQKEKKWYTISSDSLAAPFYVDDGTGEMLVLANAGANFSISSDNSYSKTYRGRAPSGVVGSFDTSSNIGEAMPDNVDVESHSLWTRIDSKIPGPSFSSLDEGLHANTDDTPSKPKTRSSRSKGRLIKTKISQSVLPVDEEVYVYGGARIRREASGSNEDRLFIGPDEQTGRFIISDKGEEDVATSFKRWGLIFLAIGLVISAIAFAALYSGTVG